MSDWLDRLAARGSGGETSVRPRLPGVFERSGGAEGIQETVFEVPAARAGGGDSARPTAHRASHRALHRASQLGRPLQRGLDVVESSAPTPEAPLATPLRATKRELRAPEAPNPVPVPTPVVPQPTEEPSAAPPAPITRAAAAAPPAREGVVTPTSVLLRPHVQLRAPAPEPPERSASEDAEPVVQVRIGRIDVRAVPPQVRPAPRRRREEASKLSLGEYVRSRKDGER